MTIPHRFPGTVGASPAAAAAGSLLMLTPLLLLLLLPGRAAAEVAAAPVPAPIPAPMPAPMPTQVAPVPQGVVALSASATVEVARDWMTLAFSTTREGADPQAVQAQLKQALDAALTEARKVASPGRLEPRTGSFSVSPRYGNKGAITGWQGSAELLVEGRDLPAIGQLAGRISSLTIARVGYDISREARQAAETQVSAEAIARYRARAADYASRFGYASYQIREVDVSTSDAVAPRPRPMLAMKAMAASADEPLATEPGTASVTVSVTGSVQLTR